LGGGFEPVTKWRYRLRIFFSASRFVWAIPESFAFNKSVFTISFYVSEIFLVRISMNRNKEIQFFTALKLFTHPTTLQAFVLSALPNFTEGRTAPITAAFFAAEFHHCTQNSITLFVVLEILAKLEPRNKPCEFIIFYLPKFLSQISCQVGDSPIETVAVTTVKTTIPNQTIILFHHIYLKPLFVLSIKTYDISHLMAPGGGFEPPRPREATS
jgi:hypothetical protein